MAGLIGPNSQPIRIYTNDIICDELPTQLLLTADFSSIDEYTADLSGLVQNGKISAVRSVFFDNARNGAKAIMTIENTNQTLVFPANTQGYLPVVMNTDIRFRLNGTAALNNILKLTLLNFMVQPFIWSATIP